MKPSRYNWVIENPEFDNWLIYNSYTNALVEIDEAGKKLLERLERGGGAEELEHDGDVAVLRDAGFLVDEEVDEVKRALRRDEKRHAAYHRRSYIELVICPTLDCNLECTYCYEKHARKGVPEPMAPSVQAKVVEVYTKLCERTAPEHSENEIPDSITWCGGEPLLCPEIVDNVHQGLRAVANKYNRKLMSGIVTNGMKLTKHNTDMLRRNEIFRVQVSIDGPEKIHNQRRRDPERPNDAYRTILQNVLAMDEEFRIAVRINVDENNAETMDELIAELGKHSVWPDMKNVRLFLAPVSDSCAGRQRIAQKDFAHLLACFRQGLVERYNQRQSLKKAKLHLHYPGSESSLSPCSPAFYKHSYVVSPTGEVCNCWETVTMPERLVGRMEDIDEGTWENRKTALFLELRKKMNCAGCKTLPICSYNCVACYLRSGKTGPNVCSAWKYTLEDTLRFNYRMEKVWPEDVKILV